MKKNSIILILSLSILTFSLSLRSSLKSSTDHSDITDLAHLTHSTLFPDPRPNSAMPRLN